MIDLRSDTVTLPVPKMREVIAEATVGDDVFGDDPTVNYFQKRAADLFGKGAALFVPSGTMSNQIAIKCHTNPGDQVICDDGAHIYRYEGGAPSIVSGVTLTTIKTDDGILTWDLIDSVLNPDNLHCPRPSLICLENSHNRAGGRVVPQEIVEDVANKATTAGIATHLDGARLWNTHIATGLTLETLATPFDSVSVCFSKGLGAPVGSVLLGTNEFIEKAKRIRKMLGGGMRQAGILAAACNYALDNHIDRLSEDHKNAQIIASGLSNRYLKITHPVETNIIIIAVSQPDNLLEHLEKSGVLAVPFGEGLIRMVTNLTVGSEDAEAALKALNCYAGESS